MPPWHFATDMLTDFVSGKLSPTKSPYIHHIATRLMRVEVFCFVAPVRPQLRPATPNLFCLMAKHFWESERDLLRSTLEQEKQEFARPASRKSRLGLAVRALRHRNFQLFFAGQAISLIGTWMQTVAQSWLVYRMTGSALLLGTVGFASQIPVFIMAPIGGIVADRNNRRRVVIGTQIASMVLAAILALLTLSGRIQVWQIMAIAAGPRRGECIRHSLRDRRS